MTLSQKQLQKLSAETFEKQRQKHFTEKLTAERKGDQDRREEEGRKGARDREIALQMLAKGLEHCQNLRIHRADR